MERIFEPKIEDAEKKKWEIAVNEVRTQIRTLRNDITCLLFKMAENDVDHDDESTENEKLRNRYVYERETSFRDEIIERIRQAVMDEKQISEFVSWHVLIGSTPEYGKHHKMDFEGDLSIVKFFEEKFSQLKSDFEKKSEIEKEKAEHIPTSEEVLVLFEKIVGEAKYETRRKLEDEQGLYLWEIEIAQEDGSIEYEYVRKGDYKARGLAGGSASETAIHVTYFDNDGIPISGTSVIKFIDNKWVETP